VTPRTMNSLIGLPRSESEVFDRRRRLREDLIVQSAPDARARDLTERRGGSFLASTAGAICCWPTGRPPTQCGACRSSPFATATEFVLPAARLQPRVRIRRQGDPAWSWSDLIGAVGSGRPARSGPGTRSDAIKPSTTSAR